ncbi:MAG: heme o synthase [Thermoplasmata archaeon]
MVTAVPHASRADRSPSVARDLVGLAKPGITFLIVLVAVAGYFLAEPPRVDLVALGILVACGAAASAGAAMLNHYLDRDIDSRMRRTARRPLPSARIRDSGAVAVAGTALLGGGVAVAGVLLNPLTALAILLGGLTYVVVYTVWLKRRSSWNIVIGGFAGSAPALAGSAAAVGAFPPAVLAFALLVFLWTPPHFWSLALLLRDDYERAGLPMLPDMRDIARSGRIVVLSTLLLLPATAVLAATGALAWPIVVVLIALAAIYLVLSLPLWTEVTKEAARRGFVYSGPYLLGVILAIAANFPLLRAVPGLAL